MIAQASLHIAQKENDMNRIELSQRLKELYDSADPKTKIGFPSKLSKQEANAAARKMEKAIGQLVSEVLGETFARRRRPIRRKARSGR